MKCCLFFEWVWFECVGNVFGCFFVVVVVFGVDVLRIKVIVSEVDEFLFDLGVGEIVKFLDVFWLYCC